MTMNLDHDELHRLLATLAESDIQEFRLEGEDFYLEVKRNLGTSSDSIASQKKIISEEIDPPQPQRKIDASPRHVPSKIIKVTDIPRTKNGKIVELAVKNIIEGNKIKNIQALANPEALKEYKNLEELKK